MAVLNLSLSDTADSVETIQKLVLKSLSDTAGSVETVSSRRTYSLLLQDVADSVEGISLTFVYSYHILPLPLSDTAGSVEIISLHRTRSLLLADIGDSVEGISLLISPPSLQDVGSSAETISSRLIRSLLLQDTAGSVETASPTTGAVTILYLSLSDTADSVETISSLRTRLLSLQDTADSAESISLPATHSLLLADTGDSVETISSLLVHLFPTLALLLQDIGDSIDSSSSILILPPFFIEGALTYAKSTYQQIADDLLEEMQEYDKLATLSADTIRLWINRAQEAITKLAYIEDEYVLGLKTGQTDYEFRDRPRITGVSVSTVPVEITAANHGLVTDDVILITGVQGINGVEGRFKVKATSGGLPATKFTIQKYGALTGATVTTPIVVTIPAHPFLTGDSITISGVTGMTEANGTWVITYIDVNQLSLDTSVGVNPYVSGGVAVCDAVGSGTYTSGGRFWRSDEIPTIFGFFREGKRTVQNYDRLLTKEEITNLLQRGKNDTALNRSFTSIEAPFLMAQWQRNGKRYLKVYPAPIENGDANLFGVLRIKGALYDNDLNTALIQLPMDWDDAIKSFVKAKIYGWLKMSDLSAKAMKDFYDSIKIVQIREPVDVRLEMTYK